MANLAQPLASVMLYIQEGENRKEVLLEMDKEQLSTFITALENANKVSFRMKIK